MLHQLLHAVSCKYSSAPVVFDSTADSLRRNDERHDGNTLDLENAMDLGEDLEDLLDGIAQNTTISTLQLEGHLLCQLNLEDCARLFDALGGLPSLKKLHLSNYVAPISMFTRFLEKARTLESITLHTVQLYGSDVEEGDEFATAIQSLPCLEAFKCCNAIVAGGLSVEKLVNALSQIWGLQKVELELERGGELSLPAMRALCQCPNLKELRLHRMTMHAEHLILIAGILQRNHTIQHLELGEMGYADHEVESYAAVANMLRYNYTLQHFQMINFRGLDDAGCILMANALEENSTLTEITVRGCDHTVLSCEAARAVGQMFRRNRCLQEWGMNTMRVDDEGATIIARALAQGNSSLETLMLQRIVGDNPTRGYLAFRKMLETNVTLQRVYPEAIGQVKREMDLLLRLNRLGLRRVQLGVNTGRAQFLQMLISNQHCLDVVFYLLSSNPDFLNS
jgi:hypothetical protein